MQTFPVVFSRNTVVFLILIIIPLTIAAGLITPVILIRNTPEWLPAVAAILVVGVSITSVLFIYKRWAAVSAEVFLDNSGLRVRLLKSSPFYRTEYSSTWEGIGNVSSNVDTQQNKRFYLITLRDSGKTIQLMPDEAADEEFETEFGTALLAYVSTYNNLHTAQTQIRNKGFYDAWWAKLLTAVAYVASVLGIIAYLASDKLPFWKLIQLLSFSAVWLAAYHANRRKARA